MISAIEGPAGCGKTTRLMDAIVQAIDSAALAQEQKVLALTFMHGARRRLADKLNGIPELRGRFECATIDSLAWKLVRRWRALVSSLGINVPNANAFDTQCDVAGLLLERPEVGNWLTA